MGERELFSIWSSSHLLYSSVAVQINFKDIYIFLNLFHRLWCWSASDFVFWKIKNGTQSCLPDQVSSSCARTCVLLWIPHLLCCSAASKWYIICLLPFRLVVRSYWNNFPSFKFLVQYSAFVYLVYIASGKNGSLDTEQCRYHAKDETSQNYQYFNMILKNLPCGQKCIACRVVWLSLSVLSQSVWLVSCLPPSAYA